MPGTENYVSTRCPFEHETEAARDKSVLLSREFVALSAFSISSSQGSGKILQPRGLSARPSATTDPPPFFSRLVLRVRKLNSSASMASPEACHEESSSPATAVWRIMSVSDVESLLRVADKIHPDLPESDYVFVERVKLFPEGCLVLVEAGEVCGYAVSHPIRNRQPPALDSLLGEISPDADQYYIHDLAILPRFRGRGLAAKGIDKLLTVAKRFPTTCLVSVYGTTSFWERFGFVPGQVDAVLSEKLHGYGEDAAYLLRKNMS